MIYIANCNCIVGDVGDEFPEEHLVAKVTELHYESCFSDKGAYLYQILDITHG